MPCSSSSASTAAPRSAMLYGPGGGAGSPLPWPGSSKRSSRNCPARAGTWASHTPREVPSELPSTSTGSPAGPSSDAARRSGPRAADSDIEEDRLAVALQPDVEPELPETGRPGDESVPSAPFGNRGEHRIGGVRLFLVGEVDPGHHPVEQPAREDGHVQVRCLGAAVAARQRPRAQGH